MIRVDRLVTPEAKSFCSTSSVRFPARAHSRATATPLMPPPMTTTWKCCPSTVGRGLTLKLMKLNRTRECQKTTGLHALEDTPTCSDSPPRPQEYEGHDSPRGE